MSSSLDQVKSPQLAERQPPRRGGKRGARGPSLDAELADLASASRQDLMEQWRQLFRAQPPLKISRDLLELGVAWKIQERALGGLRPGLQRRLARLAEGLDSRRDPPKVRATRLKPGARLIREWNGETHHVAVLADGFEWRGTTWKSLSAIAEAITGVHWSGPRFFGILSRKAAGKTAADSPAGTDASLRRKAAHDQG